MLKTDTWEIQGSMLKTDTWEIQGSMLKTDTLEIQGSMLKADTLEIQKGSGLVLDRALRSQTLLVAYEADKEKLQEA